MVRYLALLLILVFLNGLYIPTFAQTLPTQATYSQAIEYAKKQETRYRKKIGSEKWADKLIGLGFIGLDLANNLMTLSSSNTKAIGRNLAAGNALSNFYTLFFNRGKVTKREYIYAYGALTINCSLSAIQPFDALNNDFETFKTSVDNLNAQITTVEKLKYQLEMGSNTNSKLLQETETTLLEATNSFYQAKRLVNDFELVPGNLINSIDMIKTQVKKEIAKYEPDLSQIQGVVDKFTKDSLAFQGNNNQAKNTNNKVNIQVTSRSAKDNTSIANNLVVQLSQLKQYKREVDAILGSFESRKYLDNLKACGVDINYGLEVKPDGPIEYIIETDNSERKKKEQRQQYVAINGTPGYYAYLLTSPHDGINVNTNVQGNLTFINITFNNERVEEGSYRLFVGDSDRNSIVKDIVVTSGTKAQQKDSTNTSQNNNPINAVISKIIKEPNVQGTITEELSLERDQFIIRDKNIDDTLAITISGGKPTYTVSSTNSTIAAEINSKYKYPLLKIKNLKKLPNGTYDIIVSDGNNSSKTFQLIVDIPKLGNASSPETPQFVTLKFEPSGIKEINLNEATGKKLKYKVLKGYPPYTVKRNNKGIQFPHNKFKDNNITFTLNNNITEGTKSIEVQDKYGNSREIILKINPSNESLMAKKKYYPINYYKNVTKNPKNISIPGIFGKKPFKVIDGKKYSNNGLILSIIKEKVLSLNVNNDAIEGNYFYSIQDHRGINFQVKVSIF